MSSVPPVPGNPVPPPLIKEPIKEPMSWQKKAAIGILVVGIIALVALILAQVLTTGLIVGSSLFFASVAAAAVVVSALVGLAVIAWRNKAPKVDADVAENGTAA